MSKYRIIVLFSIIAVTSLYIGMGIKTEHPMDRLLTDVMKTINKTHVVNFKSGFAVNHYYDIDSIIGLDSVKPDKQWQMKREGTYDAWSKYLNFRNILQFTKTDNNDDVEDKTSLSQDPEGSMVLLPTMETYFKNGMLFSQDRETKDWTYQSKNSYQLLDLLPLHAEVMNRYAKHYKSENRGKFVVLFFSVDPSYLTRTFPDILASDNLDFPKRFREGTIKMLVYPDTNLPRRIYSIYRIENTETGEIIEYNIDSYFSADENYQDMEEPAIPSEILKYK